MFKFAPQMPATSWSNSYQRAENTYGYFGVWFNTFQNKKKTTAMCQMCNTMYARREQESSC